MKCIIPQEKFALLQLYVKIEINLQKNDRIALMAEVKIHYGLVPDKEPVFLFFGNTASMGVLMDWFKKLSENDTAEFKISDDPLFNYGNAEVVVKISSELKGFKKINNQQFAWGLTPRECLTFAELLEPLSKTGANGFNYLDSGLLNDLDVVATVGNFNPDFFRHLDDWDWKNRTDTPIW